MDNIQKVLLKYMYVASESEVTEILNYYKTDIFDTNVTFFADATLYGLAMFFNDLIDSPELLEQYISNGYVIETGSTYYFIPYQ